MNKKEKAIVFGVGIRYDLFKNTFKNDFEIVALVDNDSCKQGLCVDGFIIEIPDKCRDISCDCILITPGNPYAVEIRKQLEQMGIATTKMRFHDAAGIGKFHIDPMFFNTDLCLRQKQMLFKQNVERVIIEVNSKCNRSCWFCTNSVVSNQADNIDMSEDVFNEIVMELEKIDYDETICLSFFNEPLLCTNLIERVEALRCKLPNSCIYAFTNGDYVTKEIMNTLANAGLDMLFIDIYPDTDQKTYDFQASFIEAYNMVHKLDLQIIIDDKAERVNAFGRCDDMEVEIITRDFTTFASNRAESLPSDLPITKISGHPNLCIKNFMSFHIDYSGDVWPCPNYHYDFDAHRQYCLGNVLDNNLYDIYIGEQMTNYRERHFFHRDTLPCRSCIWNFETFKQNRFYKPFKDRPKIRYE